MNENQKAFIRRHLQELIDKDYLAKDALEDSLVILRDKQISRDFINYYNQCNSLTKTLHHFSVIDVDKELVSILGQLEKDTTLKHSSIQSLLQADQSISSILSLFKTKLSIGLGYALWLLIFANIVFAFIQLTILPKFESIFNDFGAQLPAITNAALAWQNSVLSPSMIGLFLILAVLYLFIVLKKVSVNQLLEGQSIHSKIIRLFPFVGSMIEYLQTIRWLSGLNAVTSVGQNLIESKNLLPKKPESFDNYLPDFEQFIAAAAEIDNLEEEFQFQQYQLELIAENLVTKTTAKLTASVMMLVVGYVAFTIIASYLPIFQLGAVV